MIVHKNKYCVYLHTTPDLGIFYVGKGKSSRPFSQANRNSEWTKVIEKNSGVYEVKVIKWFDNEDDALAFEAKEIKRLQPVTNRRLGGEEGRSERVAAMITPSLLNKIKRQADKRRWSVSFYIEEALIEKLAYEEEIKSAAKES